MSTTIYYSTIKILTMECLLAIIAIWPLMPGFENGLFYTSFLFRPGFSLFRIGASIVLIFLFVYGLSLLFRALRGVPLVELDGNCLQINRGRATRLQLSDIASVEGQASGNALITIKGGRPIVLPLFLCRNSGNALKQLKALTGKG